MNKLFQTFKQIVSAVYHSLVLWFYFIKSLKFSKNPILIFNYEKWHLGIDYNTRKKSYQEFLTSLGYSVICINFNSRLMVFVLNIILNGFSFDIKKNHLLNNTFSSKFLSSYKYAYWDIHIAKKKFIESGIPTDRKNYRKKFDKFVHHPENYNHWDNIYKIFNSKKVRGLVLTQLSYEELPLARFGLDNNLKIIYFESFFGVKVINSSSNSIIDQTINLFNKCVEELTESELKKHVSIIEKRIKGIEKDTERNYLLSNISNKQKPIKNYYSFNTKAKKTLCLYLHCFTDAPNESRDTESYSSFVDYFELALYIIDYCARNKVPMLIKPHPGSSLYPIDKYYIQSLVDATHKYEKSHKLSVEWVGSDFTNFYLTKISNPVIVTARGSIVSECGFLGIPSISFSKSPWQSLKNLTYFAKSEADFERIFPIIEKYFKPELSKQEGIILSAALEIGYKNMAFKVGNKSSTISNRYSIKRAWELRQEL